MIAFKTYSQAPEGANDKNFPNTYPWIAVSIAEDKKESMESAGYTVLTKEDFETLMGEQNQLIENKPVLEDITARQIRLALLGLGVSLDQVKAQIETLPEPDRSMTLVSWEYATTLSRYESHINALGQALGLTSDQIDALWVEAAKL